MISARDGCLLTFFLHQFLPEINPRELAHISDIKTLTQTMVGFEPVPDIARRVNGFWYGRENEYLETPEVRDYVFESTGTVYVKADGRDQGEGIDVFGQQAFTDYIQSSTTDCVVQWSIPQHPCFAKFHPGSVATLRVLTCNSKNNRPRLKMSYLRLGRTDAQFVSAKCNPLMVPVTNISGRLNEHGIDRDWRLYTHHPDTQEVFGQCKIPGYADAVKLCERMHARVPQLGLIGWDLVLDENENFWIIEWNAAKPAFKYMEAVYGPLFHGVRCA